MKPIKDVYPSEVWHDYGPLLESIATIAVRVDENDYQGDSWVLFVDGDRFGYLRFGWGSCSGCDALESCDSLEEVASLRDSLAADIRWGTAEEIAAYIGTVDAEVSISPDTVQHFQMEVAAYFSKAAA